MANYEKDRPWTKGNRSRTGMAKPKGSGTPITLADGDMMVSFTFRIPLSELTAWRTLCKELSTHESRITVGSMVRQATRDYVEDMTNG